MKTKVILMMALPTAVLLVLVLTWHYRPRRVSLEQIASMQNLKLNINEGVTEFQSELHWWFIDSDVVNGDTPRTVVVSPDLYGQKVLSNPEILTNWGINFDELGIDFNDNNVILAFSREIVEMKFKRANWFPYKTLSTVKTVMSKEFEQHTIYVYKIPKYYIREDLRSYTETSVEQQ